MIRYMSDLDIERQEILRRAHEMGFGGTENLDVVRRLLDNFIGHWNGKSDHFFYDGYKYHEADVHAAEELIARIEKWYTEQV